MKPGEKRTVLAVLRGLRAAGYAPVAVWDGEAYNWPDTEGRIQVTYPDDGGLPEAIDIDLTNEQVIELVDAVEASTLHFTRQHKRTWGNRGVMFVMGNEPDGSEAMVDHHAPENEAFTRILDAITNRLIEGQVL